MKLQLNGAAAALPDGANVADAVATLTAARPASRSR
jgi:hypothetical protein